MKRTKTTYGWVTLTLRGAEAPWPPPEASESSDNQVMHGWVDPTLRETEPPWSPAETTGLFYKVTHGWVTPTLRTAKLHRTKAKSDEA